MCGRINDQIYGPVHIICAVHASKTYQAWYQGLRFMLRTRGYLAGFEIYTGKGDGTPRGVIGRLLLLVGAAGTTNSTTQKILYK
jgi:hypothetical protein